MTHYTTLPGHTPATDVEASSESLGHSLADLLAQDDIVRPELRNAAILKAQREALEGRHIAKKHSTQARRS
ncbi:hypothetical protein [Halomonas rhizosphaerae]|uniref:Uncharacterized protein n=1 Tax=Halomonas rhizosphaerae TaxID=3043296 RepID=A0ABT6V2U4_9GAMM|nr:hypothetical protein [Halomonas rhizosphaerae]MDI5891813.1 hypothetical protein [Halomonas rhizosphaerae]